MAKTPKKLSRIDIILNAEADVIKDALESRLKIDELLDARTEAYRQIADIEQQIESTVGEEGLFLYPEPALPVAGAAKGPSARRVDRPKPDKPATLGKSPLKAKKGPSTNPADTPEHAPVGS